MLTVVRPEVHRPVAIPHVSGGWVPGCDCGQWADRQPVAERAWAQALAEAWHCQRANGEQVEP